ncbi:MAG: AMP-binding protein, partial [Acidobacteria bacterium]|nr:AMP-binding protein [Candidatus Sulfomarinibacter sp. MAG AM2]
MGSTLNECFIEVVERRGNGTAFLVKRDGAWRSFSYSWALEQVRGTAFGLSSLGYERGTRFGILSENRPEWATTDYGAMAAGFVLVPLYTTLIPSQVAYILNDAEARMVFVSSMDHLETIRSIRDQVPSLEKVVVFYPEDLDEDEFVISLDSLKKLGEGHSIADFTKMSLGAAPEDTATFVYTSGTTGDPKGVVLSHGNLMAQYDAIRPAIGGAGDGSISISFLPLSHILQRVVDSLALLHGMTAAYAESLETLGENLREVRPNIIVAVPRVWEKIFSRIHEGVQKGSAVKRGLFNWAVGVGRRFRELEYRGSVPFALSLEHSVADALVFKKIRAATGGRMEVFVSTGAPLAKELAVFFHAVGITIIEVWGMTELSGGATINTLDDFLFGSVGKPGPGVELKVTDIGEICVRGDIVMQEYWRKPEATTETIDSEGWLHSGDVG